MATLTNSTSNPEPDDKLYTLTVALKLQDTIKLEEVFLKNKLSEEYLYFIKNNKQYVKASNNAFKLACEKNLIEIVQELLKDDSIDPSSNNNKCLDIACYRGYVEIAKLLLNHEKVKQKDLKCAFDSAVNLNIPKIIELFLPLTFIPSKNTISRVCDLGLTQVLKEILQMKNIQLDYYAMMMTALRSNKLDIIQLLLEKSDIDLTYDNNYYIRYTVTNSKIEAFRLLLKHPQTTKEAKEACLRISCIKNRMEFINLLIAEDIDFSTQNNKPIKYAIKNNNIDVVKMLIQKINLTPELKAELLKEINAIEYTCQRKKMLKLFNENKSKVDSKQSLLLAIELARSGLDNDKIMDIIGKINS